MTIAKMTDRELIALYCDLYHSVYVIECYGLSDLGLLDQAEAELDRRGYDFEPCIPAVVKREEE